MRMLMINRDLTIEEVDRAEDEMMAERDWTAVRIDAGHDAYSDDEGLYAPGATFVDIGGNPKVPLPAHVVGFDGEDMVAATITEDELRRLIA